MKYKVLTGFLAVNILLTSHVFADSITTNSTIQENEAKLQQENQAVNDIKAKQSDLTVEIKESISKIQDLQIQKIEQNSEILNLKRELQNLSEKEKDTVARIGKREARLEDMALTLQEEDRSMYFLKMLTDADSISNFLDRLNLALKIADLDKTLLDQLVKDRENLKDIQSVRSEQLTKVQKESARLKETENELLAEKKRQEELVKKLEREKKVKIDNIYQLQSQIVDQKQQLAIQEQLRKQRESVGGSVPSVSLYNYDVRNISNVTAEQIDRMLAGTKLAGYGKKYVEVGKMNGVDPAFLASVSMAETGGTAIDRRNNVGGLMKRGGGKMSFTSINECIDYMGLLFVRMYINDGLVTVEQIHDRYSPDGAANDPTNLNQNWVGNVYKFMGEAGVKL